MKEADGLGKNSVDMGYQLQKIGNEWKEYSVLIEQYIRDERVDFDDNELNLCHSSPLHRNSRTKHVQTSSFYLRVPSPNLPSQVQVVVIFDAPRINSTFVGKFGNLN